MKNAIGFPDLMDELAAIRDGLCIWCRAGIGHPEYSRCAHAAVPARGRNHDDAIQFDGRVSHAHRGGGIEMDLVA